MKRGRQNQLSAKDLRELKAAPRVSRVILPDGRQRVQVPKEQRRRERGGK